MVKVRPSSQTQFCLKAKQYPLLGTHLLVSIALWCICSGQVGCSVQFSSVAQLCPTLCDSMNRSTPGLPVHHHLLKFTQTHVHRVHDAIQPSHPLSSPSSPAPNPSQHQSPFQWVSLADWFVSLYLVQSLRAFTVLNTSILPVLAFLPCTAHPFSLYSFHPFIPPSTVYHLISHCSLFTQSNLILCTGK